MYDPTLCGAVILELDSIKSPPTGVGGLSATVMALGLNRSSCQSPQGGHSFLEHWNNIFGNTL